MTDHDDLDEVDAGNQVPAPTATAMLEFVVKQLVDDPEAVQIRHGRGRRGVRLDVLVGPGDLGRVIGRKGRTAQSIRTVVRAAATKDRTEVDIEFVDA